MAKRFLNKPEFFDSDISDTEADEIDLVDRFEYDQRVRKPIDLDSFAKNPKKAIEDFLKEV